MKEQEYTTLRIYKHQHDILRYMAFKEDKKMIDIMDALLRGKGPTISERVDEALLNKLSTKRKR